MALEDVAAVAEPVEAPAEEVQTDTSEEQVDPQETQEDVALKPDPTDEVELDFRKVPAELREFFKSAEGKQAKAAWYERQAFRESFADGPKAATELLAKLDEYGGLQGVEAKFQELTASADELKQIDSLLVEGKAELFDRIEKVSPDALDKLAPEFMDRWAKKNPEAFAKNAYSTASHLNTANGIDRDIEFALGWLEQGNAEKAMQYLTRISQTTQAMKAEAQKAIAPKVNHAPEIDKRTADLDKRDADMFQRDFNGKTSDLSWSLIGEALKPYTNGKTLDATGDRLFKQTLRSEFNDRLNADKKYQDRMNAFYAAKDVEGALKAHRAKVTEIADGVAKTVSRPFYGSPASKPSPKPAVTATPVRSAKKVDPWDAAFA